MYQITKQQIGIVDIHTHAGGMDLFEFFSISTSCAQSVSDIILKAEINDINQIVVFPMPAVPYYNIKKILDSQIWIPSGLEDFPYCISNQVLLNEIRECNTEKVLPFLIIDPIEKISEQIDFLTHQIDEGFVYGLELHTRATRSKATDLVNSPFVDLLKHYNLPIIIHSSPTPPSTSARYILDLAKKHPEIRISIAHLAAFDISILSALNEIPNLFVDCAPLLQLCQEAEQKITNSESKQLFTTDYSDPARVLIDLNNFIPGKLLWGTDEPWAIRTYSESCNILRELVHLGFSEVKQSVASSNSGNFLFG